MVTAATEPREIVANVFLGERLLAEREGVYGRLGVTVAREHRSTKEYRRGQEVYVLGFEEPVSEDDAGGIGATKPGPDATRD